MAIENTHVSAYVRNLSDTSKAMITTEAFQLSTTLQLATSFPIAKKPLAIEDILGRYWEFNLSRDLGLYGYPFIVFPGTIGNVLTLLVMLKPSMRRSSTCFYMTSLAVFDTFVLYLACFRQWLALLLDTDILNSTAGACKTLNFLSYACFDIAVWTLVAMTIERFIAVHFHLNARRIETVSRARAVLASLIAVFIGINAHFFWTINIDARGFCSYVEDYDYFHDKIWPWLDAVIYSLLPFLLLLVFNVIIIYDTQRSFIVRRSTLHIQRMHSSRGDNSHQSRLSAMLITVSVVFLLLSAPNVVLISVRNKYFHFSTLNLDLHNVAVYRLVATITNFCLYLNHAVNFLLYCISGQRFRKELWLLFHCRWKSRQVRTRTFSASYTRSERLSESSTAASPSLNWREAENYM